MLQAELCFVAPGHITSGEPHPVLLHQRWRRAAGSHANQRGGHGAEILELQQYRRLYEEQEDKNKISLVEKESEVQALRAAIGERDEQIQALHQRIQDGGGEVERLRADYTRLQGEAQQKIDKLMERIKQLNQRLVAQ